MNLRRSLRAGSAALVLALAVPTTASAAGGAVVVRPPRIQLGDAPAVGYPGSDLDRISVLWETSGGVPGEDFDAAIRKVGSSVWTDAGPVTSHHVDRGARLAHRVDITGLDWHTEYEYRIRRLIGPDVVQSWEHRFTTRLEAGDPHPFSFAAYGDSAWIESIAEFDAVQARIVDVGASFTLLLGDNGYMRGTSAQLDLRFDPAASPASASLVTGHVEFPAFGNHDVQTGGGRPTEEAFATPIPVAGVTAPVAPPGDERPEHSYSFDHGNAHFVTFDSNAITSAARLDDLLDWVVADLAASDATWKIVFIHHAIGVPDKADELAEHPYYLRRLVRRLEAAGVDLLLAGHSHTFSWTYPLAGLSGGAPVFVADDDREYRQGDGLVQVVSGVGGHSVRDVVYDVPYVAASFTGVTDPAAEVGFALVSVSSFGLTVQYVAAGSGRVLGEFSIVIPIPAFGGGLLAR